MNELQLDDPDPLPSDGRYKFRENLETGLAYEGYDLTEDLLEQELLSRDERADVEQLCNYASQLLEAYGNGEQTRLSLHTDDVQLYRVIEDGMWIFTMIDTLEDRRRCRSWKLGGDGMNWCDDERRYEETSLVLKRLQEAFPEKQSRVKRLLAAIGIQAA